MAGMHRITGPYRGYNELQALVAAEHKVRLEIDQLPPSWEPFTAPDQLVDSTR